jgi:DNA-binding MarR family transcriptional regulator
VDARTAQILGTLKHPGAVFLSRLLEGPATEAELLEEATDVNQATANRRLDRLADLGVIQREPGQPKAPGRRWSLVFAEESDNLVSAAVTLSEAIARREQEERDRLRRRLRRARAHRRFRAAG